MDARDRACLGDVLNALIVGHVDVIVEEILDRGVGATKDVRDTFFAGGCFAGKQGAIGEL